ncbi:hypothetical protein IAQ61_006891 [Plenodomus lingam]|uniref:uncharacterized protein n=1 Tax=Leptosphaeria maculans TaxID=5022 RepID=UPI00331E1439|nr:hypothetical protein IAQ61_006891 [Plenodomus lingam]
MSRTYSTSPKLPQLNQKSFLGYIQKDCDLESFTNPPAVPRLYEASRAVAYVAGTRYEGATTHAANASVQSAPVQTAATLHRVLSTHEPRQ